MESSPAARVLTAPCPPNPYTGWAYHGGPTAHQMAHSTPQGSFLFHGGHAAASQVMATNQASAPMYNLQHQYHQYHSVGNSSTSSASAMSMAHGFMGSPHHPPTGFAHAASAGGEHGNQLGAMGSHFPALMFNMDRSNERK